MYEAEASRLRELARQESVRFLYTKHAEVELAKDGISKLEIQRMLRRCRVSLIEESRGEETWRAEGSNLDGRSITAVVVAYEDRVIIKIVTGWTSSCGG